MEDLMIDLTGRKRIEARPFIPNGFEAAGKPVVIGEEIFGK